MLCFVLCQLGSLVGGQVALGGIAGEHIRDGFALLLAVDAIQPGLVDWRLVHRPPLQNLWRKPKSLENCNQVGAMMPQTNRPPLNR